MNIISTPLQDLYIIEPKVFKDERGYFLETHNEETLRKKGLDFHFVQDNQSKSSYGVIRGLHYQLAPYTQTKLIRAIQGKIFDAVVDVRKGSPTYGQWYGVELSDDNFLQLLVPKGFAHGFSVLSETAIVHYKVDSVYNPQSERGILYSDKSIGIDWHIKPEDAVVSPKDKLLPDISKTEMNFVFGKI